MHDLIVARIRLKPVATEERMDRIAVGIVVVGIIGSAALVGAGFWLAERTTVQVIAWASDKFGPPAAID